MSGGRLGVGGLVFEGRKWVCGGGAAPGPASCVRWHKQLEARGGVVEDDGVERRSGAAASAALVVHQEDEKARLGSGAPVLRAKGEFPSLFRRAEHRSTGALAVQF